MTVSLPIKVKLLLSSLLLFVLVAQSQVPSANGVKKGMVKVKFAPTMGTALGQMKVKAANNGLLTGFANIDRVAKTTKSKNMTRMFPYDARHEHKLRKHGLHLWYVVEVDESMDPKAVIAQFKQLAEIEIAEVEHEKIIAPFQVTPYTPGTTTFDVQPFNDPLLKDQWHYNNTSQMGFGDADINLFEAWAHTTGANNIIVSVHDQGVDVKHKDLEANIWINAAEKNGQPNVDDDGNGYVDDINGWNFQKKNGKIDAEYHGTHVAGTIAAVNNNGVGVAGVAGGNGNGNGVKIMSMQILGGAAIEKSFVYAANNGAVISQNSWGYTSPYYYDQSVLDAIDYFIEEAGDYPGSPMSGGLVIFAAGNSNSSEQWYPAYHPNVLAVASLGPEWKRAPYSNFGEWVELAAPGGDQDYGGKGGVLSTIPKDQYAYMQGTSMACPHVSGIAALALSNRTSQLTAAELRNKLVTGTVNIDDYNPDFIGMLGSGAINASLAIQNDMGLAPATITNLSISGVSQEFATVTWTVPADEDDSAPTGFQIYYHTQPITPGNLGQATSIELKNSALAGTTASHEVSNLLGLTTYYFAITAADRWGNVSLLSNIAEVTTNQGPAIAMDENSQSIHLNIDASVGTSATHNITILNNAEGLLRWNHLMRHKNTELAFNAASIRYPKASKPTSEPKILRLQSVDKPKIADTHVKPLAFEPQEMAYTSYTTNIIGETDLNLTNSAASKFTVTQTAGFNLTQARMYLKHNPALGPVVVEVYKGGTPAKANLIYAQEYSSWGNNEGWANITLNEQLYFEHGSTFWLVFHVPSGNLFPLGIGYEADPAYSTYCYMSFDMGNKWAPLEQLLDTEDFAWSVVAASYNEHLGTYLTLTPGSGDVQGLHQSETVLTADAATLINGDYSANLIITSNDAQNKELRIPVSLTVSGHQPDIKHIDIADFGNAFVGTEKIMELVLDNQGFGNFNNPQFSMQGNQFEIDGFAPWQIKAREKVSLRIKFKPTAPGNSNDLLTITNESQTYQIPLFGIGAETATIAVSPEQQSIDHVTIGDAVQAQLTVENTGAYPLKYFIPGFDEKGVSQNWPSGYHQYGYKYRTNNSNEANPIAYEFQDISTTGVDITQDLISDNKYFAVDMGFAFPYYGTTQDKIYIAQKGFTAFTDRVRPINSPSLNGGIYSPDGYLSILGTYLSYLTQGKIFYQLEADRMIIQFDNVTDNWSGSATAQMVLFANGNIRFFYDNITFPPDYLSILIEDIDKQDGILINNYSKRIDLYSGLALGFDYPGPNIISGITNGSGIIMPGSSASVTVNLNTASLAEGTTNRYINFISNDPAHAQTNSLIQLNITQGGTAIPVLSTDTIAFGNVFQGATRTVPVIIKNQGTANVNIASMAFVNGSYELTGDQPIAINPGLYKKYSIALPTSTLGSFEDWLSIQYANGTYDTIYVTGGVVVPPAIQVDLSGIQETLEYGETSSHPFTIKNTGLANLEVSTAGAQWLSFATDNTPSGFTYAVEKHNNGNFYQWLDIRKTGTQLPFLDYQDFQGTFWRELELPFPIQFYGEAYSKLKIGDNGLISFEDEPQASLFTDYIPSQIHAGPCIIPYWTFSGFSDYLYPIEDIGIFYQYYDDKIVILWSYFTNNFGGMGDPVSAEIVIYKNGTMKFQYKREEGGTDLTSHFGTIGLQKDSNTGIAISQYLPLDHGSGLAYMIVPANKLVIAPGATLSGNIKIDATNIYGGTYTSDLKIETNVPNQEHLVKSVELTVNGEAVLGADAEIDFGSKMISNDQWGMPIANYQESTLSNLGSAPLEISWMQMADGFQGLSLQVFALVDGWFGPEWRWADISELYSPWNWNPPLFKINPGDVLQVRASFAPQLAGEVVDEVVLTTSIGEHRISLKGSAVEPPAIHVDTTPIEVSMNTTSEMATRSIAFDNRNGFSPLDYKVSIDYGRVATSTKEGMAITGSGANLLSVKVQNTVSIKPFSTYNRTISHTDKSVPDTFIGTGGSAPFTLATRYNAGPEGLNLSHIETFFRPETLTSGNIQVEIRAGGSSIADAATISTGTLTFNGNGSDNTGAWYAVALDKASQIFPNENFYVVVTYPLGIQYPQGSFLNSPQAAGRYLYFDEGLWYDLQEAPDFASTGWLMYAAEQTAGAGTWLALNSESGGTLQPGESSAVALTLTGQFANSGDQIANIVFASNDPNQAEVRVPVKLHLNEAPRFGIIPEKVVLAENETKTVTISVQDIEGNTFTVASAQNYPHVAMTVANGLISISLTPDFNSAGDYQYIFKATDQFNAVRELALLVEVTPTNRAPVFIGTSDEMAFTVNDAMKEFSMSAFFSDPDGDNMTFTVTSSDEAVVMVFASTSKFLVQPLTAGEADLTFTLTDSNGAILTQIISVTVEVILGVEPGITTSMQVYPNPSSSVVLVELPTHWRGSATLNLMDATGSSVMSSTLQGNTEKAIINISHLPAGVLLLRVTHGNEIQIQRIIKK